jgi:hypothetical protein
MTMIARHLGRAAGALLLGLALLAFATSSLIARMHDSASMREAFGKVPASSLTLGLAGLLLAGSGFYMLLGFVRHSLDAAREVEAEQAIQAPRRRMLDADTIRAAERAQAIAPAAPALKRAPPALPSSGLSPESEEAIAWLATQPARVRDWIASNWPWESDLRVLKWLVEQEDCDAGTAAGVFWVSGAAEDFVPFGADEPEDEADLLTAEIEAVIARRFAEGGFVRHEFGFDTSWPMDAWMPRLRACHAAGGIDWDPGVIPTTASRGPCTLNDLGPEEATAATGFLEEFTRP